MTTVLPVESRRKIFGVNVNVFFLGIVSLLTDVSSEMIFTLMPLFLSNVLGVGTTIIGFVAGLTESTDAIFKIFSGWFSDKLGKRKFLAVIGYSLSTVAKPFMYLASSWGTVLAVRFSDRVGKGIRGAPRDALVADSLTADQMGRGFGLHRMMDTLGATLGLVLAAVIIYSVQGGGIDLSLPAYRWLIIVGTVPAVLAVPVLLTLVHESGSRPANKGNQGVFNTRGLKNGLSSRFFMFLSIMAVFTLGNSSDFFVILRAQNLGVPLIQVTLMLVLLNVVYAVVSLPAGILSDNLGRTRVMALGWVIYALTYLGFAVVTSIWQVWFLFAIYGVYYGLIEGVGRAYVADLVSVEKRGTAYGLYHGVIGIALFPASVIAGWLWSAVSPAATFYFGAALAFLAMLGMVVLMRK